MINTKSIWKTHQSFGRPINVLIILILFGSILSGQVETNVIKSFGFPPFNISFPIGMELEILSPTSQANESAIRFQNIYGRPSMAIQNNESFFNYQFTSGENPDLVVRPNYGGQAEILIEAPTKLGDSQDKMVRLTSQYNPNTEYYSGEIEVYGEDSRTIKIDGQGSNDNDGTGSAITMYDNLVRPTVKLQSYTQPVVDDHTIGTHGRIEIQAYGVYPGLTQDDLDNITVLQKNQPYNMLSLSKKEGGQFTLFGWHLGLLQNGEFDVVTGLFDIYNHYQSLTFAFESPQGTKIKRLIDSDGSAHSASDKKLKTQISSINNGREVISKLAPKSYNWKNIKRQNKSFGFIAQEVQKILPGLIKEVPDPDGKGKTLLMNYEGLIPFLTAAIQEQQEIIDSDRKRLSVLESELQEVKNEIKLVTKN